MLGKTNTTALREGAVITEIEDYRWVRMTSGIHGDFVKAVYKNGLLAAVTADGKVAHTADGEVWEVSEPEFAGCRFCDIEWDGNRFILVGSCESEDSTKRTGLILTTADFASYEKKELTNDGKPEEYLTVLVRNGRYILVTSIPSVVSTDFEQTTYKNMANSYRITMGVTVAKNENAILVYVHERSESGLVSYTHSLYMVEEELIRRLKTYDYNPPYAMLSLLECKGALYTMGRITGLNYNLDKITEAGEIMTMNTGQNFMFVDGVYFDGCQIFINSHEMLVVKKAESLAEKNTEDLKEIVPESTLRCVTKAFGQLYLFGNQGLVLRSSVEAGNEGPVTIQTLSAKKALAEAKVYADQRIGELEKRIAELEKKLSGTSLGEDLSSYVKRGYHTFDGAIDT